LLIPLWVWFSLTYSIRECLPIGDSDSDTFAQGILESSKIEKITIHFNKLDEFDIDCSKLKALPKFEFSDKNKISKFNKALELDCSKLPCTNSDLGRTYQGFAIAELASRKKVYFAFRIYPDRSTYIQVASRSFELYAKERIVNKNFSDLILPDLKKLDDTSKIKS
jgi:hypothetical protein